MRRGWSRLVYINPQSKPRSWARAARQLQGCRSTHACQPRSLPAADAHLKVSRSALSLSLMPSAILSITKSLRASAMALVA